MPDIKGRAELLGRVVPLDPNGITLSTWQTNAWPVIGTGASAIQFIPEIQPHVAHLNLFQRTAPTCSLALTPAFSNAHHKLFQRIPVI